MTLGDIRSNNNIIFQRVVYNGNTDVAMYLVSKGLTIEDIRRNDNYALRCACRQNNVSMLKYLLGRGLTVSDIIRYETELTDDDESVIRKFKVIELLKDQNMDLDDIASYSAIGFLIISFFEIG